MIGHLSLPMSSLATERSRHQWIRIHQRTDTIGLMDGLHEPLESVRLPVDFDKHLSFVPNRDQWTTCRRRWEFIQRHGITRILRFRPGDAHGRLSKDGHCKWNGEAQPPLRYWPPPLGLLLLGLRGNFRRLRTKL